MAPRFFPATLTFLRALKRNNNRDWFKARREHYDKVVREPMLAVIDQLAVDLRKIAPELIASPKASMYRIYRDTRFSADKTPLKTHIAAVFPWRGMMRHQGAGLYFEIAPKWVWAGGGMYAPEPPDLFHVREHIVSTWPELQRIVRHRAFKTNFTALDGARLTRVPRGFLSDHPAAEYLKHRQFLAGREFPPGLATSSEFYPTILSTFKAATPLIRFLNEAVSGSPSNL
jgi:uncharacterized protein (TIGR02453 family)